MAPLIKGCCGCFGLQQGVLFIAGLSILFGLWEISSLFQGRRLYINALLGLGLVVVNGAGIWSIRTRHKFFIVTYTVLYILLDLTHAALFVYSLTVVLGPDFVDTTARDCFTSNDGHFNGSMPVPGNSTAHPVTFDDCQSASEVLQQTETVQFILQFIAGLYFALVVEEYCRDFVKDPSKYTNDFFGTHGSDWGRSPNFITSPSNIYPPSRRQEPDPFAYDLPRYQPNLPDYVEKVNEGSAAPPAGNTTTASPPAATASSATANSSSVST